jgi:Predicted membrane protein
LAMIATTHLAGHAQESKATRSVHAVYQAEIRPLLQKYCVSCHSGKKPKGGFGPGQHVTRLRPNGAAWNGVLERLNDHTMPPKGKPQPSDSEGKTVTDWITSGLKAYQQDRANTQGRALLRRLNRIRVQQHHQ